MAKRKPSFKEKNPKDAQQKALKKTTKAPASKAKSKAKGTSAQAAKAKPKELTREEIAARAYDLYLRRGQTPGDPVEDWLQAERELRTERQG